MWLISSSYFMKRAVLVLIHLLFFINISYAQVLTPLSEHEKYRQKINRGTVGIISGGITGTYIRMANDLALVLDDNETHKLRVLPIPGKGGVSNIRDLLYLKGIDVALVQSDILNYIEQNKIFNNIRNRVNYISKLYDSEMHILVKRGITDISQLEGKKVNFWNKGSATDITGKTVFKEFSVNVIPVYIDQKLALEKMQTGEIAATMDIVGKPSLDFFKIAREDGITLLPIPFRGSLAEIYLPAKFSHKDYPNLIPKGKIVSTVASGAVLAVYNWPKNHPRYKKVSQFIYAFFNRFSEFRKEPRHKKWREASLNARLPGWTRFAAAQEYLSSSGKNSENFNDKSNSFIRYLEKENINISPRQKKEISKKFNEFLKK